MKSLTESFTEFIRANELFSPDDRLFVAVSGGIDSVVLAELLRRAGYSFTIVHCNFRLRGAESDRDETFVRQLANRLGQDILVRHFDTAAYAGKEKLSIQAAARALRYDWFARLVSEWPAPALLLTAHHADDSAETLLMNFFKGTGMAGLHGILPKQGHVVRPLLFATREDIRRFAEAEKISWVEDSSNATDDYTRNFLRHQIIPRIEEVYPGLRSNLAGNMNRFREIEELYRESVDRWRKKIGEWRGEEFFLPILRLNKIPFARTLLWEIGKEYGFSPAQIPEMLALTASQSGRFVESATHRVFRHGQFLILAPRQSDTSQTIFIESGNGLIDFPNGRLKIRQTPGENHRIDPSPAVAQFDAATLHYPLILRKWKAGDYFYPLGLGKKKKVSRLLIDAKWSSTEKEKTWVIEMDRKIIWVIGLRIDDRFKTGPHTREVTVMEWQKASLP